MKNEDSYDMFLGLRHSKEKQSDPRLACFMFQKIYNIYRDNSDMQLKSMSEQE